MVITRGLLRFVFRVSVLLLFGVAIWAIIPKSAVTGGDPYGMMIRDALGAYHEIHGRFPSKLLDIEPLIDGNADIKCAIQHVQEKKYLAIIQAASSGDHFVEVIYSVGADGTLEDYDVRILDSLPDK